MIDQIHRLDVIPGGTTVVIHVKQYQTDESLKFELYSRMGDFEIDANFTSCTVRGTKSDGNGYSATAECIAATKEITVQLTEQMTAVAGIQPYEITVTDNTGRMITATFLLYVHRAALDAGTVVSESVIREVQTIVEDYIEDHPGLFVVDDTLTVSGEAADAKVTGDEIADLKSAIGDLDDLTTEDKTDLVSAINEAASTGGGGLTEEVKVALLNCFENVAWINDQGQTYYDAFEEALYPPANLVSISAVYTQSGTVYDTDTLDSLKTDLVVTAHYDDSSTAVVTSYTLSGTLTAGTSTITVIYGGETTAFNVTVTHYDNSVYSWDFTTSMIDSKSGVEASILTDTVVSRDSDGLTWNGTGRGEVYLCNLSEYASTGYTVEIDVGTLVTGGSLLTLYTSQQGGGKNGVRFNGTQWLFNDTSNTNKTPEQTVSDVGFFNGATFKFHCDYANTTWAVYRNNVLAFNYTSVYGSANNRHYLSLGTMATAVASYFGEGTNIKAVRVYEGLV